ncbi:type III pantothenate kinase [Seonamhaeicola aphaedonensis]|uniref:Type III pantothenate kinase n=1 Tax=Seonamhaeicola aphaedonensis TaxID=1461338 RepID=A0A3D9HLB5_9FLAO|nr:type III pantothenate kinase [Seonamhaeicola aphaedonensis]RED50205.1 type III pantothenate kinase [Seonamhaeicola aphaedonensis]
MNLIVDVGNSFVKLAVFSKTILKHKQTIECDALFENVKLLVKRFKSIKQGIISSVGTLNNEDISEINEFVRLLILNSETRLPFKNEYKTPRTLGVDRIALVSAAVRLYPNKDVLVIDAGTCITYDFINSRNEYLGGAISPGLRTRYKSLNNLTANLPLLETEQPKDIIGVSTKESMHAGVIFGALNEIDGMIDSYKLKYPDLTVILTGGDANFLSKQLKNSIFANSNFLLEGLNYILQYNSNE